MMNRDLVLQSGMMKARTLFPTLVRYAVVGLTTNAIGYGVYLLVTWMGVPPKMAVTLLYPVGAMVSFLGNRKWTFSHEGEALPSLVRYWVTHCMGYGLNWLLLYVFVDHLGHPHQWVQGIAVFVVAGFLFVMFRFFVFPHVGPDMHS